MSEIKRETDIETAKKSQTVVNRENFQAMLVAQNLCRDSESGLEAKRAATTMLSAKTGMYVKIPFDLAPQGEYCIRDNYGVYSKGVIHKIEQGAAEGAKLGVWDAIKKGHKGDPAAWDTVGGYSGRKMAGSNMMASAAGRVVTDGGLYRDSNGDFDIMEFR